MVASRAVLGTALTQPTVSVVPHINTTNQDVEMQRRCLGGLNSLRQFVFSLLILSLYPCMQETHVYFSDYSPGMLLTWLHSRCEDC